MPRRRARAAASCCSAARPGSGKSRLVREFAARGGRRRRARPLRRLRRGRAHALRAVRRGARSARADDRPAELRRRARRRRRRADPAAARSARRGSASCRSRSRPTPTPSATASTPRSPTCSPTSARRRPVLLVLEDGHWADAPDAPAPAPPGARRRQRAPAAARHLPRHRGRRARRRSRRRSPTCAAPTTSCGCGSRASPATRSADFVRRAAGGDLGAELRELADDDPRPHRRQRLPRLRAVARRWSRPGAVEVDRRRRSG